MSFVLSIFRLGTCILPHFTFLVWLLTRIFSTPITLFFPLKPHFLVPILPFGAMCFVVLRGFIYTIAVYFYAFCLSFNSILPCVLRQNVLHLAPKRTTFSGKRPPKWCKWCFLEINIHFVSIHMPPHFVPKQTSARIDFLRQGGRLRAKIALIMLKNTPKSWQNEVYLRYRIRPHLLNPPSKQQWRNNISEGHNCAHAHNGYCS